MKLSALTVFNELIEFNCEKINFNEKCDYFEICKIVDKQVVNCGKINNKLDEKLFSCV